DVGVLGAVAQERVERLAGRLLDLGEALPGAVEELLTPAVEELLVRRQLAALRLAYLRRQGLRPRPLALQVGDQVRDGRLDEVAEPATLGVGVLEGAAHQAEGE